MTWIADTILLGYWRQLARNARANGWRVFGGMRRNGKRSHRAIFSWSLD